MNKESKPLKPFARSEREKLREHFVKRAGEAPIPNPFELVAEAVSQYVKGVGE